MPPPALKSFAAALYDHLTPIADKDAANGYALANYLGGAGEMFQVVDDYGRDQLVNGEIAPGWSQLLDVNRCPTEALPWLAQFVGVSLQQGLSGADARAAIKNAGGWKRGTPAAMVAAAQQYLTGSKSVTMIERDPGASPLQPAYGLTIYTLISETPNSAQVLAALLAQKPAGIVLNYQTITAWTYQGIFTGEATYQAIYTSFNTYQGVFNDQPGT